MHWVMANVGLALMVGGFVAMPHVGVVARIPLAAGGGLSASGAYAFVYNLWRTIEGRAQTPAARPAHPGAAVAAPPRRLPLLG